MKDLKKNKFSIKGNRATTQTWMTLTFVLFVGLSVLAVTFYALLTLRVQVNDVAFESLKKHASHISEMLAGEDDDQALVNRASGMARLSHYRITVVSNDRVLIDIDGDNVYPAGGQFDDPIFIEARNHGSSIATETGETGKIQIFVALPINDKYLIRVGELNPIVHNILPRMQITLILGVVIVIFLAVLGSWIASGQVTSPLRAITESARRINEGDLSREIIVHSRAVEFTELAKELNTMAIKFKYDINQLQKVTRIQNEFIGNVSHEVKNPIFAVGGYLEVLAMPLEEDQRKRFVEKGLNNLQRLNNLFSDLIEIAKLEYREDLIHPEKFDIQELLDEIVESTEAKAKSKGLFLETMNSPVWVEADRNRIRQVMTNLIENGINYTEEGTVSCNIRRRKDKVLIAIRDTGRGIGEDHLGRIFERFYRVDSARSRQQGGTGLGLSIVKQILQAHREDIHVESTQGRGTRFWFELPFTEPPSPEDDDFA